MTTTDYYETAFGSLVGIWAEVRGEASQGGDRKYVYDWTQREPTDTFRWTPEVKRSSRRHLSVKYLYAMTHYTPLLANKPETKSIETLQDQSQHDS